jgi:Tubulin binding cofactor A
MPPPTPLQIATSSLNRLIKEEASYHKELSQQEGRISKLEASEQDDDGNREFSLRQEVWSCFCAVLLFGGCLRLRVIFCPDLWVLTYL